jgi:hypothetical protein
MNEPISLIKKLNQHLGLTENENLNSNNRLEGWTRYEFSRPDNRTYGYDYIIGMIEFWLGVDLVDTRYTILHLGTDKPEIEDLSFFELINAIKTDWILSSYISIYSEGYSKVIHINDSGYYWKSF